MNPNTKESLASIFEQSKHSDVFWEEMAVLSFTGSVLERLKSQGLTKKDLAKKMNVSPAYVTKLIGGSNNFTLRTMVRVARLLKCELNIGLRAAVATSKVTTEKPEVREILLCHKALNSAANDYENLALAA